MLLDLIQIPKQKTHRHVTFNWLLNTNINGNKHERKVKAVCSRIGTASWEREVRSATSTVVYQQQGDVKMVCRTPVEEETLKGMLRDLRQRRVRLLDNTSREKCISFM